MALEGTATSGAASAQTITLTAVPGQYIRLFAIDAYTSAGTSTVTIKDGSTSIWVSPGGWATATGVTRDWGSHPLFASVGANLVISTTSAGGANTCTINYHADRYTAG